MDEKYLDMIADRILKISYMKTEYFFCSTIYQFLAAEYPDIAIKDCVKIVEKIQDKIIGE